MSSDALRSYLRTLRTAQHMTQRQLAEAIGAQERTVSEWERGTVGSLKASVLLRIAEVLRASLEDMIALETGWAVSAVEGEKAAHHRLASMYTIPAEPAPVVVRIIGSAALASRLDACASPVPVQAGSRTYEGRYLPHNRAQVLVNGEPLHLVMQGSGIAASHSWIHAGQASVQLARCLLWCEFGAGGEALKPAQLARDVLAELPRERGWVLDGHELVRWAMLLRFTMPSYARA